MIFWNITDECILSCFFLAGKAVRKLELEFRFPGCHGGGCMVTESGQVVRQCF